MELNRQRNILLLDEEITRQELVWALGEFEGKSSSR